MCVLPIYVGLGYHQSSIQVCILASDGKLLANRQVDNDALAVRDLNGSYGRPRSLAIEACCGAANVEEPLRGRSSEEGPE